MESINQAHERKINAWCYRHNISKTFPLSQKETLYELYHNPHHVPSEEIILSMLKATPKPIDHKRPTTNNWGQQNQAGWKKT